MRIHTANKRAKLKERIRVEKVARIEDMERGERLHRTGKLWLRQFSTFARKSRKKMRGPRQFKIVDFLALELRAEPIPFGLHIPLVRRDQSGWRP